MSFQIAIVCFKMTVRPRSGVQGVFSAHGQLAFPGSCETRLEVTVTISLHYSTPGQACHQMSTAFLDVGQIYDAWLI